MFAKFGFLIVLLAFGVLALLSGLMMPEKFQQRLPGFEALKAKFLPAGASGKASTAAASIPVAASAPAASSPAAAPPPSLESLLIPSPLPAKGNYALQLGLFPENEGAEELAAKVNGLKLPGIEAKTIEVVGAGGKSWFVAYAKEAANPEELEPARLRLEEVLGLQSLRPVMLPPPKGGKS